MTIMPIVMAHAVLMFARMLAIVSFAHMDYFRSPGAKVGTLLRLVSACGVPKDLLPMFEALVRDEWQGEHGDFLFRIMIPVIENTAVIISKSKDVLEELGTLPGNMARDVEVIRSSVFDEKATGHLMAMCVRGIWKCMKCETVNLC